MRDKLNIVWFKRDLRVSDHRALVAAAARGPVLPLYVVEPELWQQPDASARHWLFIAQSLHALRRDLAKLGQPLVLRMGPIIDILEHFRRAHGIQALWSHEETGNGWTYSRDLAVAAWARGNGIAWHELTQNGVQRRLADRNGWAAAWDRTMSQPICDPPPQIPPLEGIEPGAVPGLGDIGLTDDGCVLRQTGGRGAGLDLLDSFLAGRGQDYRRQMSNPLAGATACSRLSPHFAWGTIALREAAQATWTRLRDLKGEVEPGAKALRASLTSFSGRLHWHCHFMQKLESEPSIETRELHPALRGLRPAQADPELLKAWSRGQTGYPFLDACMRSLSATGWLNFRMRAMVMSFASYNLWLPWRQTGLHLARQFTDYEPGIHWPQSQMQSGTTGINTIRIYSVIKQGYDQDKQGVFVRRWVPELAEVPDQFLQEPWHYGGAGSIVGHTYPARIVDWKASTAAAKDKIYGARRASGFSAAAGHIVAKHGSRKGRDPALKVPRKAAKPAKSQFEMDL